MLLWKTWLMLAADIRDRARRQLTELLPVYLQPSGDVDWDFPGGGSLRVLTLSTLSPRGVGRLEGGPGTLVIAPWISPRTRELLDRGGYSYIDLTGNVRLSVERPPIYVRLQGADRDPAPSARPPARWNGPRARRLVRMLVDTMPPYRLTDLADASGLSKGYVSTLLQAMTEAALIERDRRGSILDVDWPALLAVGAEGYQLLRNNAAAGYVAPGGPRALYERLSVPGAPRAIVTGSFAASAIAPVAAPAQLVLYASDPAAVRRFGRLLPAERGADVVILQAEDESAQLVGTRTLDCAEHVALSQLVLDCLGGNGRLPEEAAAVLTWMRTNPSTWRLTSLPALQ
ncbi:helix-turn-helix domain-containing protein [Dactylosporangium sp. NPDC005555]|uniref:helix-turn-helix domain-containing protein n=1 Tax=Dactylosporangium sp. NPDC005555 TaxID=3154889 RepID=UPI00339DEF44